MHTVYSIFMYAYVINSFTLEISLGGSTMPSRPYTHFNTADYEAVGRHFCETLIDFSDPSVEKVQMSCAINWI